MDIEKILTDGIVFKGRKLSSEKKEEKVKTDVAVQIVIRINKIR